MRRTLYGVPAKARRKRATLATPPGESSMNQQNRMAKPGVCSSLYRCCIVFH